MSPDTVPSRDYIRRSGAPPGFKRIHLVIGAVIFVVWFAVMGYVLTHGRDEASSVDVYSELPSGFNDALASQGVTYTGLSPVDPTTQSQVLARVSAPAGSSGAKPLVFRTSYTVSEGSQPGSPTAALMVVIPASSGALHVDFVDPTTYRELDSVDTP